MLTIKKIVTVFELIDIHIMSLKMNFQNVFQNQI